jgi:hypothetical protein
MAGDKRSKTEHRCHRSTPLPRPGYTLDVSMTVDWSQTTLSSGPPGEGWSYNGLPVDFGNNVNTRGIGYWSIAGLSEPPSIVLAGIGAVAGLAYSGWGRQQRCELRTARRSVDR